MTKYSLDKDKIKVLLLEGVHPNSVDNFKSAGYTNVEYVKGSLEEEALIEKIRDVHFIGIRLKKFSTQRKNWLPSVASVSAPTRLIWQQLKNAVFLYSTRHSQIPAA